MSKRKKQGVRPADFHATGLADLAKAAAISATISAGAFAMYFGFSSQDADKRIPVSHPASVFQVYSQRSTAPCSSASYNSLHVKEIGLDDARRDESKRQAYLSRVASDLGIRVKYDPTGSFSSSHLDVLVKRFSPPSRKSFKVHDLKLGLHDLAAVPFTRYSFGRDDRSCVYVFRKFFTYGWVPSGSNKSGFIKASSDDIAHGGMILSGARYAHQTDDDVKSTLFHESVHLIQSSQGVNIGMSRLDCQVASRLKGSNYRFFVALGELQAYCDQLLCFGRRSRPRMNLDLWAEVYANFEDITNYVYSQKMVMPVLSSAVEALKSKTSQVRDLCYPPVMFNRRMPSHSRQD